MAKSSFDTDKIRKICEAKVVEVVSENTSLSGLKIIYCDEEQDWTKLFQHIKLEIIPGSPKRVGIGPSGIMRHRPVFLVNMYIKKQDTIENNAMMRTFINALTTKLLNKEINSVVFCGITNFQRKVNNEWVNNVSSFEMMYDEFL